MSQGTVSPRYVINMREHPVDAALSMGHNLLYTPWQGREVIELTHIENTRYHKENPSTENHPFLRLIVRIALLCTGILPLIAYLSTGLFQKRVSPVDSKAAEQPTPQESPTSPVIDSDVLEKLRIFVSKQPPEQPFLPAVITEEEVEAFKKTLVELTGLALNEALFIAPFAVKGELTSYEVAALVKDKEAFLKQHALVEAAQVTSKLDEKGQKKWEILHAAAELLQTKTLTEIRTQALQDNHVRHHPVGRPASPARVEGKDALRIVAPTGSPLRRAMDNAPRRGINPQEELQQDSRTLPIESDVRKTAESFSEADQVEFVRQVGLLPSISTPVRQVIANPQVMKFLGELAILWLTKS